MAANLLEWGAKALAGGLLVVLFAVLAELVTPKRLAGILAAAPSVALGSLVVTVVALGTSDAASAAGGMVIGAAAFTVYCLIAVKLIGPMRVRTGAVVALAGWAVTAGVLLVLVPS